MVGRSAPWLRRGAALAFCLVLTACSRDEVRVYQAAKETPPALPPAQGNPHGMGAPERKAVAWTVPQGWTDKGASGMRAGSFGVTGTNGQAADVSVIAMQTWSGQELDNVNRWRAQVGLQRITAEELPQNTTTIPVAGLNASLFDMAGTPFDGDKPTRILVAVLPLPQVAYYFKMSGDDALVAAQKNTFVEFLKSVHFGAPETPAVAASADDGPEEALPKWEVPQGWQKQTPGRMQAARFTAAGPNNAAAEVTFSTLGGTGGGLLANVNRWRKQLALPPLDEAGLAKATASLDMKSGTGTVVDMTAENKQNRIVAAVVPHGDATWFFRLSGPDAAVEAQKAAFLRFVQTAHAE